MALESINLVLQGRHAGQQGVSPGPQITRAEWATFRNRMNEVLLPADAMASDTNDYGLFYCVAGITITNCYVISAGALTADNTSYATLTVQTKHSATLTTVSTLTTKITGSNDWVAKSIFTMTTATPIAAVATDTINLNIAKASSGVALPVFSVAFEWYYT